LPVIPVERLDRPERDSGSASTDFSLASIARISEVHAQADVFSGAMVATVSL
jgi:hypothetical protein